MRARIIWIITSALLLGLTLALGVGLPSAQAQEPPPRPTPMPTVRPEEVHEPEPTAVPPGRITGTVIELGSGAPAPGISVRLGNAVLTTDGSGNYDAEGIPAGIYRVALDLAPGQGEAAQEPITLQLAPGAVLVQHLAFRAPVTASPAEPSSVTTATTTPDPAIASAPAMLPNTGATDGLFLWPSLVIGLMAGVVGLLLRRSGRR